MCKILRTFFSLNLVLKRAHYFPGVLFMFHKVVLNFESVMKSDSVTVY